MSTDAMADNLDQAIQAAADALRHQKRLIWSPAAIERQARLCVEAAAPILLQATHEATEVEHLLGCLRRLEWPQPMPGGSLGPGIHCPICGNVREYGHAPDCWLAAELARSRHAPREEQR